MNNRLIGWLTGWSIDTYICALPVHMGEDNTNKKYNAQIIKTLIQLSSAKNLQTEEKKKQ